MTLSKLAELTNAFDSNGIDYSIVAGFGLDAIRGFQSRPHGDVDMIVLKSDYELIRRVTRQLNYAGEINEGRLIIKREDGAEADLDMASIEKDEIVLTGPKKITRIPLELYENSRVITLEGLRLKIACNEILRLWGSYDRKGTDKEYAESLPIDLELFNKIKRIDRN